MTSLFVSLRFVSLVRSSSSSSSSSLLLLLLLLLLVVVVAVSCVFDVVAAVLLFLADTNPKDGGNIRDSDVIEQAVAAQTTTCENNLLLLW